MTVLTVHLSVISDIRYFRRKPPPPVSKQNLQKRPLTPGSPSKFSPPHKRKPSHFSSPENRVLNLSGEPFETNQQQQSTITSLLRGTNSSRVMGSNSSHSDTVSSQFGSSQLSIQAKEREGLKLLNSIKKEPVEEPLQTNGGNGEVSDTGNKNGMSPTDQMSPQQGIVNRPRSLIPLANISKKYGTGRSHVKQEFHDEDVALLDDQLPSQDSILRSLYDQPIYGLDSPVLSNDRSDSPSQMPLSLPHNLSNSMDKYPASTENPVLAGYYDSDNYPRYRQSRKNPAKKSKAKEKLNVSSLSLNDSNNPGSQNQEVRMRTFESGGRLVYACDVCKRELSHLTSYRRHMKLHTMERPHKCPVCSKGFIRKYHCIDHMNKHHKDVDFDSETLSLTGQARAMYSSPTPSGDNQALSDSYSISPSEYNYTLDQSLDSVTDANQSMNLSIDQSASSILSELARSAAKHNQKDELKDTQGMSPFTEKSNASTGEPDIDPCEVKDGVTSPENEKSVDDDDNQSVCSSPSRKSSLTDKKGYSSSPESKDGSSAMARKQEVSEGIKAIVAHLKSSSRRKKMLNDSENDASKTKQVLEEAN